MPAGIRKPCISQGRCDYGFEQMREYIFTNGINIPIVSLKVLAFIFFMVIM